MDGTTEKEGKPHVKRRLTKLLGYTPVIKAQHDAAAAASNINRTMCPPPAFPPVQAKTACRGDLEPMGNATFMNEYTGASYIMSNGE